MRILHITASIDAKAGGVSQAVRTIIRGLAESGVQNDVVCLDEQGTQLPADQFEGYFFGPGKSSWKYAPELLAWLYKHLNEYDVAIVHGLWQYHSFAAQKAWSSLRGKKPKMLVMPHGMLDPYFQKASSRKIKALRNWLYWKLIENKLINNADGMLFTAEIEREVSSQPFKPYKVKSEHVVGLGVETPPSFDLKMFDAFKEQSGQTINDPYILFLGRIDHKKGVRELVTAYLRHKNEGTVLPKLVIAGPGGDSEYGQMIHMMSNDCDDIVFTGMLTGDAKWAAFYGSEAFILPSHQENFGISNAEALACSKPVLISDKINIWKEIEEGGGGIVETDTTEGAYQLIKKWIAKTPVEKQKFSENALSTYRNNFSFEMANAKFLKAINFQPTNRQAKINA